MPPESVDLVPLLSAARVTIVAGKGGVGKTTVTAVLARAAAAAGLRVLAVELDGKPFLAELLGDPPGRGSGRRPEVIALSAPAALEEYLREHGLGRVAKRLSASGVIDVVSTAAPGIDDLVVLGRIKQLERSGDWDAIVVDGPAAGHATTMLTAAAGLGDAVSSGPIRIQADGVLAMLGDRRRCQVMLVTLAETTPVSETIETAKTMEERTPVHLGPIVVNCVDVADPALPDATSAAIGAALTGLDDKSAAALRDAAAFRAERRAVQGAAIEELASSLPRDQIHLPLLPVVEFDAAATDRLLAGARPYRQPGVPAHG